MAVNYLNNCMYFVANSLSRTLTKMAEEEFMITRLSPPHAIMLIIVVENSGISLKELSDLMNLAPSTISRFADKLVQKKMIERKINGKKTELFSTIKGREVNPLIIQAWKNLYVRYSDCLGKDFADKLTDYIRMATIDLRESSG